MQQGRTLVIPANARQVDTQHALLHTGTFWDSLGTNSRARQYSWSTERPGRKDYELCPTDSMCFGWPN